MRRLMLAIVAALALSCGLANARDLSKYVGKYSDENVDGRTILDIIRKDFISKFGLNKWRLLQNYGTNAPIEKMGEPLDWFLAFHRCKPHDCADHNALVVMDSHAQKLYASCFYEHGKDSYDIDWVGNGWSLKLHSSSVVSIAEEEDRKKGGQILACDKDSFKEAVGIAIGWAE
jgi:hypothetical protein